MGSSKTITLLLPQNAIAMHNLLLYPPDKFLANEFLTFCNSKSLIKSSTSFLIWLFSFEPYFFLSYFNKQNVSRFSFTVKLSYKILLFW